MLYKHYGYKHYGHQLSVLTRMDYGGGLSGVYISSNWAVIDHLLYKDYVP